MLVIPLDERYMIDSYRPQTDNVQPLRVITDNPNEDLQTVGGTNLPELPAADVGGQNASRIQNGYSTGFFSRAQRFQRFLGQMAKPPAITNPVQGEVGSSARASKLYSGVMSQLVEYVPAQAVYVSTYVGSVPTTAIARSGR